MERISQGRLFQTVGPVTEKFVVGTRSLKLSEDDQRWREGVYAVILTDTWEQWHGDDTLYWILHDLGSQWRGVKNRSDVILPTNNKPGSSILLHLELINEILGCSCKQGITIVQFWDLKKKNQCFGRSTGKILTNGGNATQFYVSRCAHIGDMPVQSDTAVNDNAPVYNLAWKFDIWQTYTLRGWHWNCSRYMPRRNEHWPRFSIIKLQLFLCHPRFDLTDKVLHSVQPWCNP